MTRRTRGLLPITGDERQLCHALGLSDDFVRDLDDLLLSHTGRPLRGVVFTILRKMNRAGCVRRAPADANVAVKKPSDTDALAKLDAALVRVAEGSLAPHPSGRPPGRGRGQPLDGRAPAAPASSSREDRTS